MIKRIVKLTIKQENTADFIQIFESSKAQIAGQPGCHRVELLQDKNDPRIFFTYSFWDSEADLANYKKTALFGEVWPKTKALFDEKPETWSTNSLMHYDSL